MSRQTRHLLDAEQAKDVLHDLMPIGEGETPTEVWGWRDSRGDLRRARAAYPNGWQLDVFFSKPQGGQVIPTSCKASRRFTITGKASG